MRSGHAPDISDIPDMHRTFRTFRTCIGHSGHAPDTDEHGAVQNAAGHAGHAPDKSDIKPDIKPDTNRTCTGHQTGHKPDMHRTSPEAAPKRKVTLRPASSTARLHARCEQRSEARGWRSGSTARERCDPAVVSTYGAPARTAAGEHNKQADLQTATPYVRTGGHTRRSGGNHHGPRRASHCPRRALAGGSQASHCPRSRPNSLAEREVREAGLSPAAPRPPAMSITACVIAASALPRRPPRFSHRARGRQGRLSHLSRPVPNHSRGCAPAPCPVASRAQSFVR